MKAITGLIIYILLISSTLTLLYTCSLSDDIETQYTLITEDSDVLALSACDSMGAVITAPNHTFENVVKGYIVKTQPNVIMLTFFENGVFSMSPYTALALVAGLDTNLVCETTMLMGDFMSVTGSISLADTSISNGAYWIAFDEVDHCCYALVTFNAQN